MENEEIVRTTRFVEGDKVLVKNIGVGSSTVGVNFTFEMQDMIGKVWEISRVENSLYGIRYGINNNGLWRFGEEWLEPVNIQAEEEKEEVVVERNIVLNYEATEEDIQEMISKVDIKTFLQIIRARVFYERGTTDITIEHIMPVLREWAKAKFRFYKLFNKKLVIVQKNVQVAKDEGFFREELSVIRESFPIYTPIFDSIHMQDIIENKMGEYSNNVFYKDKKVKVGMKFTRLMALYGNEDLNMAVSKLYQNKAKKDVYISIDPCDYLTTSINKSWRSCHNFMDGEYRNAGLALMQDNTSLIAYSCSDKIFDYSYEGVKFKWNSKNWRQMVYVSETNSQMIFSLQYPYQSVELSEAVRKLMEDKMTKKLKLIDKWLIRNNKENIHLTTSRYMYNDVGRSGCKFVINKYDKNKECYITTGKRDIKQLNSDYDIEGSDYSIWD